MLCYSNDGFSFRAVDNDYIPQTGEELFADHATTEQLNQVFTNYNYGIPLLTKSQKLSALNDKYALQFQAIQLAAGTILLNATDWSSISAALITIQQQNNDLKAQKSQEEEVILNGN